MSRAYGWRASCPAGGVTVVGVGSGAWLGDFLIFDLEFASAMFAYASTAQHELCAVRTYHMGLWRVWRRHKNRDQSERTEQHTPTKPTANALLLLSGGDSGHKAETDPNDDKHRG